MKIFPITLGCKVNQYETQVMLELLSPQGFVPCATQREADVVLLNSCTVTGTGDQKVRQTLRRARRQNPNAILILTGCMPQAFPETADSLPEADIVMGNANRNQLPRLVEEFLRSRQRIVAISPHPKQSGEAYEPMRVTDFHERTRAFVKIEDGCNRFCSYCIIPTARGRVRSRDPEDLRQELIGLVANGYREIVLVGINLSAYGQEWGGDLCDAVEIACGIDGVQRVRLGSLEPDRMTDEVIERLARQPKLCPQFHLSLQSGCDRTLKAMNRHYTSADYAAIVKKLRDCFENAAITTDVMVGFPQESDEDFSASLAFVKEIAFAKVHVFAYSRRPGTVADRMGGQISNAVKEERSRRMIAVTDQTREEFLHRQIGTETMVLFETEVAPHVYEGYTPNYTPVKVTSPDDLCNTSSLVTIEGIENDACVGRLK